MSSKVAALLELVGDTERFETRLRKLKEAEERANAAIALVGPAQEIAQLRSRVELELLEQQRRTKEAEATGDALLELAREEAKRVTDEANAYAKSVTLEADTKHAEASAALANAKSDLARVQHATQELHQELHKARSAADVERALAHEKASAVDAEIAKLSNDRRRLESVRQQIIEALSQ